MFAIRLSVQVPLYLSEGVVALGVARVAMGWPLFLLTLWLSWLVIKRARMQQQAIDAAAGAAADEPASTPEKGSGSGPGTPST